MFFYDEATKQFIVVHAIHKTTQRIPEDDISTAVSRMDDWNERQPVH